MGADAHGVREDDDPFGLHEPPSLRRGADVSLVRAGAQRQEVKAMPFMKNKMKKKDEANLEDMREQMSEADLSGPVTMEAAGEEPEEVSAVEATPSVEEEKREADGGFGRAGRPLSAPTGGL